MFRVMYQDTGSESVAQGNDAKECLSNLLLAINDEQVDTENRFLELVEEPD